MGEGTHKKELRLWGYCMYFLLKFIVFFMNRFYAKSGLKFECLECGECCRLPGGRVEVSIAEAQGIAHYLNVGFSEFLDEYCQMTEEGISLKDSEELHCVFLEDNRCRIYPIRPLQCRTFPFWPENLKSAYRWIGVKTFCPGINRGKHFSPEFIESVCQMQRQEDKRRSEESLNDFG
ncbi:MAG: hypothetical protein Kow0042_28060 [Calditrichia bacterium]